MSASRQHQLLVTCKDIKNTCIDGKFKTTEHKTIMEHLRIQADRFRKQGRLQEDEMEAIIREMKEELSGQEVRDQPAKPGRQGGGTRAGAGGGRRRPAANPRRDTQH